VNGTPVSVAVAGGRFSTNVPLQPGRNEIEATASDAATPPTTGRSGVIAVTRDSVPPRLSVRLTDPTDVTVITVSADEPLPVMPEVSVNETAVGMHRVAADAWSGAYGSSLSPIPYGNYTVYVATADGAGNRATERATFTKTQITTDGATAAIVTNAGTTANVEVQTSGAILTRSDFSLTQTSANRPATCAIRRA
jgi:hypothetical protein